MAYVGNQPARGQWRKLSDISSGFNGVTTTFTTSVPPGTSEYFVTAGSASQLLISLGGVIQEPDVDYTVSTNSVTFTTPPTSGLSFFGVLCGDALNAGVPSDGSVTTSKLAGGLSVGLTGGSASNPSLFFTGDDNTGLFSPSADTIAFAEGGAEALRIDSSGRLLVGTSSGNGLFGGGTQNPRFQIEGTTGDTILSSLTANRNDAAGPTFYLAHSRGTASGGTTVLQSGDQCGIIAFAGTDGTDYVTAASITANVDGTPGANDMPGRLVFSTTADGESSPTERMRIQNSGNTYVNNCPAFYPNADNFTQLGGLSNRWSAVYAVNGTIQTSDARAKTEVADSSLGSDFVKALRPVSYKWTEGGQRHTGEYDEENNYIYESVPGARTHWGFIAQEVKQAVDDADVDFGGWVLTDKDDPDSQQALRYDQFIAPLTKALQETMAELEALKAEVAALKAQ